MCGIAQHFFSAGRDFSLLLMLSVYWCLNCAFLLWLLCVPDLQEVDSKLIQPDFLKQDAGHFFM